MSSPDKKEPQSTSQSTEPATKPVRIQRPLPTEPEVVMRGGNGKDDKDQG